MKKQKVILSLGVAVTLALVAGCDNKPTTQTETNTAKDAGKAAEGVAAEATKAVEAAKPAAEKAVTDAQSTAAAATADANAKANTIIDQAKALVGQNKYSEALSTLGNLSGLKLTAEQEKVVADLKAQIQKAMSSEGAKAAGGLLKP